MVTAHLRVFILYLTIVRLALGADNGTTTESTTTTTPSTMANNGVSLVFTYLTTITCIT